MITINFDERQKGMYVKVHNKIEEGDFPKTVRTALDQALKTNNEINNILIDASDFHGWNSINALIEHLDFVKDYNKYISRIAVITDNDWQATFTKLASTLVHPKIKCFHSNEREEATRWLQELATFA